MLDPLSISYHNAPFAIALASWEGLRRRGVPWVTLLVSGGILLTAQLGAHPDALNAVYLGWSVPVAAYLAITLFAPRLLERRPAPARRVAHAAS